MNPTLTPDLVQQLASQGFHPGTPAHLSEAAQRIDRQSCSRLKCGACGGRGHHYRPFTNGRRYRVLAICKGCGAADER